MADDLLRQFYARAGRTLSIAYEVFQELSRRDETSREAALTRSELELAAWQADIDAHDAYQAALSEFNAARAVRQHVGSIGTKPEAPTWPPVLPQSDEINLFFGILHTLKGNIENFRFAIRHSLSIDDSFLSGIAKTLGVMGHSLDRMNERLEQPQPIIDELVTLDQQDSRGKIRQKQPDNVDVRDLCKLLETNRQQLEAGTKSEIGIAREYTREPVGGCPKADNLLRQARRYQHLWK